MSTKKVLHLTRWYPNSEEPLLGIFVQKHIHSLQHKYQNKAISIYQTNKIKSPIYRSENIVNNTKEVIYYHKKGFYNKLKVVLQVWKESKQYQPDIIHSHIMGWPSTLAYFLSIFYKYPFLITEHWTGYRRNKYFKLSYISKILRKISGKKAKKIFVVSKFLKSDMEKCGIEANYIEIGNVVDGKSIETEKNKKFSFVVAGDLIQETKNIKGVLEAFSVILKDNNIQLDIIGDGKDLNNYKKQTMLLNIQDHVFFHGNQSNEYVFKILSKSHALILNSYFETFSIICAEALLCGIPVIATKCGGPESFLSKETGIIIEVGKNKELSEAMKKMIQYHNQYDSEKLKKIAEKFSVKRISEKISVEYESALH